MLCGLKTNETTLKKTTKLSYKINIPELMQRHFPVKYGFATQAVIDGIVNDLDEIEVLPTNEALSEKSAIGVPVWDYLKINNTVVEGSNEVYYGYKFPATTVIEAIRPKKIVATDVVGKDGTIDELMGLQDWELKIKGLIINYDSTDYPEDLVRELQELCELKHTQLPCEGTFLTMLGVQYLNITRLSLPALVGYGNVQKFEIEAKSKNMFVLNP